MELLKRCLIEELKNPLMNVGEIIPTPMSKKDQKIWERIPILQDHQTNLNHWYIPKNMGTPATIKN